MSTLAGQLWAGMLGVLTLIGGGACLMFAADEWANHREWEGWFRRLTGREAKAVTAHAPRLGLLGTVVLVELRTRQATGWARARTDELAQITASPRRHWEDRVGSHRAGPGTMMPARTLIATLERERAARTLELTS